MTESQRPRLDASLILALVAVLIVASHDRRWLSRPVNELVPEGIRLDWLSHLKARLVAVFLAAVVKALTRGRPGAERTAGSTLALDEDMRRVRETYEARLRSEKKRKVREWLVEVHERLRRDHGLGVGEFCKALGVSARTFRSWRGRGVHADAPVPAPEPKPPRKPRGEGRFDLDRTLPGIQQMVDTTDWKLLGNNFKIVAAQDPGDRHRELWSSFRLGVVETGQVILNLAEEVVQPGGQFIDDRGTPYMSAETQKGLDDLEAEHAPCKEYTPTEKATCERSFRTVKEALAPVVAFLDDLADRVPDLRCSKIAVALGGLLLDLFHRAYNLGHRGVRHPLAGEDEEVLRCIAEEQREKARSEMRSKLSTLGRIHGAYGMLCSRSQFVRTHRCHALEDIVEAERRMGGEVLRGGEIRSPHHYFAAVLRDVATTGRARRMKERAEHRRRAEETRDHRRDAARLVYLDTNPVALMHHGLDHLAAQWREGRFLFGGVAGRGMVETAVARLAVKDLHGFVDEVRLECQRWHGGRKSPRPPIDVVLEIVDGIIVKVKHDGRPCEVTSGASSGGT